MKTFIITLAAAATIAGASQVEAGPSTLAGCYDLVIDSCNANSNHPQACAKNGMNQCDKQFRQSTRPADTAHGSRLTGIRAHKPFSTTTASKICVGKTNLFPGGYCVDHDPD